MYRQRVVLGVILAILMSALCAGPASAGRTETTAMGGAGLALLEGVSAIDLNPAGAAGIDRPTVHATFNLVGQVSGPQQVFAYGEPDAGYGAGVLGLVRSRTATGFDPGAGVTYYDTGNAWTYVVAKEFASGSTAGGRFVYEVRESEQRSIGGAGYRLDAGVIQDLGGGFSAGLRVDNVLGTSIRWSDGSREAYVRSFGGGIAYRTESLTAALDVEGTLESTDLTVRFGARWHWADFSVIGGVTAQSGSTAFSLGGAYRTGPWRIEYAYVSGSDLHRAGLTWSF